jgi:hypothetical protein
LTQIPDGPDASFEPERLVQLLLTRRI